MCRCADFATLVAIDCSPVGYAERVCLNPECFRETYKAVQSKQATAGRSIEWRALRTDVLRSRIADACADVAIDDDRYLRLAAILVTEHFETAKAFNKEVLGLNERADDADRFKLLFAMTPDEAKVAFVKALITRLRIEGYGDFLRLVCAAFGVTLDGFTMDEAFLKRFDEHGLRAIGKEIGLFDDEGVKAYAAGRVEAGKWESADLKKMERKQLIALFTKSGFDLTGKAPKRLLEAE